VNCKDIPILGSDSVSHLRRDIRLGTVSVLVMLGTGVPSAFAAAGSASGVATTVSVSTSSVSPGSANTANGQTDVKLSQDDVLKIAKGLFPNLFSASASPNISLHPDYGGGVGQVYTLNWTPMAYGRESGPQVNNTFTNVTIDANTGQVKQYQHNTSDWAVADTEISADKAQAIADTWLQKLAPNQAKELVLQSGSGATTPGFVYQFMRKVNGIIVPFDSATIQLDSSGELSMYSFSWHDATFKGVPSTLMSAADAAAKYRQNLNLQLQYQQSYSPSERGSLHLVYQPQSLDPGSRLTETTPILDAESGQLIGLDGKSVTNAPSSDVSPLVPGGLTEFPKAQNQPISQANLEKQITAQFGLTGDDWTLSGVQQQVNGSGPMSNHPVLDLDYMNQKTHDNLSIQVDMMDGVIENYNANSQSGRDTSNGSTSSSTVDAQTVADAFVKKLFPHLTGAISRANESKFFGQQGNQAMFAYDFIVGGVPVQGFNLNVDTTTGSIIFYGLTQDPSVDFPSAKGAISADAAKAAYLKKDPVVLQYVLPQTEDANSNSQFPIQYGNQAQLVYAATPLPEGPGTLDALTGDWIYFPFGLKTGVTYPTGSTEADKAVATLEQNHVIIGDEGKANLSDPLTHAEFIAWLSRAYNYNIGGSPAPQFSDVSADNPYATDISMALMQGWLPNTGKLNPSAMVTRDDAARWLVDWMGWQGPAAHIEFFKIPFSDITDVPVSDRGAAAMISTSGILPLENGKFNPNQKLTVGDAAIALMNAVHVFMENK
jgi:hypothetical protein